MISAFRVVRCEAIRFVVMMLLLQFFRDCGAETRILDLSSHRPSDWSTAGKYPWEVPKRPQEIQFRWRLNWSSFERRAIRCLTSSWRLGVRTVPGSLRAISCVRCEQLVAKEEGVSDGATGNVSAPVVDGRTTTIVSPSEGASMRSSLATEPKSGSEWKWDSDYVEDQALVF